MTFSFMKPIEKIHAGSGRDLPNIFRSFLIFGACALAQGRKEELYFEELKRYEKKDMSLFTQAFGYLINDMESHPYQDLLGDIHQEFGSPSSKQASGEFYTPYHLCLAMAKMTMPAPPESHRITVHEPCTGSGRMVLAMAEVLANDYKINPTRMWVSAWDTSFSAVLMTFINTTLWGIPCEVVHGNTLSLECWSTWTNSMAIMYPLPPQPKVVPEVPIQKEEEEETPKASIAVPTTPIKLGGEAVQANLFDTPKEKAIAKGDHVKLQDHWAIVADSRPRGVLVLLFTDQKNQDLDSAVTFFQEKFENKEVMEADMWAGETVKLTNFQWDEEKRKLWLLTERVFWNS